MVGDHWTPYDPPDPESFPEGSTLHIIVPGDTLWDLSGHYLSNPYLWPQIWDVNQYVRDSHWIYPGDPLLIPSQPTVISQDEEPAIERIEPPEGEGAGSMVATPEPTGPVGAPPTAAATPSPVPAGPVLTPIANETDIYCTSMIVDEFVHPDLRVREREDGSRTILGTGDIVFLNHGLDSNLTAGEEFSIVAPVGKVDHPIFEETVGELVQNVGRLRIIALQERSATAQIVHSCHAVEVGMSLVPYEEIPLPLATPGEFRRYGVELSTANAGYIVETPDGRGSVGEGDVVNIDMGSENGLQSGDLLTIFREWGGSVQYDSPDSYIVGQQARAELRRADPDQDPSNYAQTILGQMVVLRIQQHTATAKIIVSAKEIVRGDRVATN